MLIARPCEERVGPSRAPVQVVRNRVEGDASGEHSLYLCMDRLHPDLTPGLGQDRQNRATDCPELASSVRRTKVRIGMELWCALDNPDIRPTSNLEITWGKGNFFHLTALNSAVCDGNDPRCETMAA